MSNNTSIDHNMFLGVVSNINSEIGFSTNIVALELKFGA